MGTVTGGTRDGHHCPRTLGCLACGGPCCPQCVIQLESAAYCLACARGLLEIASVRASGPYTFV